MKTVELKQEIRNILRENFKKSLNEGRIPKLFLKIEAVKKDIKKLEAERKSKFGGDYAKTVNAEKDPKKRANLMKPISDITKKIAAQQKNLADMLEMEDKYISQMGMDQELDTSVFEAITNPKKSNPNDLATTVIGWYDFATDYIDDGGQRRRAIKSNEDVVNWFDSHPSDVKQKAFKVMLSKQPSIKSKIERVFGSSLKESVNETNLREGKYYVTYNKGRGQGKDLEKEFDQKTFKTTNKPKVFNSYNDAKKYAEKMEKMFRNSIGGGTAYWVSDEKMNPIKESVITEDTRRVKLLGIDFKISEMNGRIFFSFVDKKAASVSLRQVGTNKIVNHIQNRLDIAYGKGTFFFKSGDHAEFQNGYLFQRNTPDINLNKLKFESVNEGKLSISQLPFKFLFNYPIAHTSTPGNFQDWYRDGMKLKKGRIEKFSPEDDKQLRSLINIWWDEVDDVSTADFNAGRDSKEIKKVKKDIQDFLIKKSKVISESVNEASEPEIISQLKDIVKNQQYQSIKDPKTGKKVKVDMQTANAVLQIYNGLSNVNKDNMVKMGLPKMIEVAWKIISKYR